MKHMKHLAMATLLLLGVSGAAAQSLGDYARAARKSKPEPSSTSRHYDNDNLPTGQPLGVVGPPPAGDADAGQGTENANSTPAAKAAGVEFAFSVPCPASASPAGGGPTTLSGWPVGRLSLS